MTKTTALKSRDLSEAAEHQMRMWALRRESQTQLEKQSGTVSLQQLIHPYVAISRESGVDGGEIAKLVAAQCNWKILDRELLDYMAENFHWSRIAMEYVDERTASWFHEMFCKWLDQELVSQAEYVSRLGKVILMAAQHECTVFVGRGVQFILPRDLGLSVRIIAPKQPRIKRIIERLEVSKGAAEKFIDDTDKGRADFVWRYFHRDVADPRFYDLVINLEYIPRDDAIDVIVTAAKRHMERMSVKASGRMSAQRQFRRLNQT